MGYNTNVEDRSFNVNVDNTTRQGNTFNGVDVPEPVVREGQQDQPEEVVEDDDEDDEPFDPGEHKVREVKQWVREHPDQRYIVHGAEEDGKARSTLLTWLNEEDLSE